MVNNKAETVGEKRATESTGKVILLLIWRKILPVIFILVLVHFLKDITQDILHIATQLDRLGDVKEDLSGFPPVIQTLYVVLGFV